MPLDVADDQPGEVGIQVLLHGREARGLGGCGSCDRVAAARGRVSARDAGGLAWLDGAAGWRAGGDATGGEFGEEGLVLGLEAIEEGVELGGLRGGGLELGG